MTYGLTVLLYTTASRVATLSSQNCKFILREREPPSLILPSTNRYFTVISVAAQNFCQKISKLLSKLSGKYFPALTQQNRDLGGLSFGQDADGNWGYKIGGADTVVPFKGELDFDYEHNVSIPYVVAAGNPNVLHYYTMTEEDAAYSYLALFAVTAGSVVSIELSGVSGPSIVCNKPGGNYSFALIANPVLNGKVNFRHGGTGDGHVFKLMIK